MLLLGLFLTLISSLLGGFLARYIGLSNSRLIIVTFAYITAFLCYYLYYEVVILGEEVSVNLLDWISVGSFSTDWTFRVDDLGATMLIPITTVSALVHHYSLSYMSSDPHQPRFFALLSMFTFFMGILVSGSNYLVMFVGWEYIGVTSYLLISFWYTRIQAMKAALSAVLLNRCGDAFLFLGIISMIWVFGSVNFSTVVSLTSYVNTDILNLIGICFVIAATAKSAQLGLHVWLLQAMEGIGMAINDHQINLQSKTINSPSPAEQVLYVGGGENNNEKIKGVLTVRKEVYVYDINHQKLVNNKPFRSILECSNELHITRGTISKYLDSDNLYKYGYLFRSKRIKFENLKKYELFSEELKGIITGWLLGDGWLEKVKGLRSHSRLAFTISKKNIEYIHHIRFLIKNISTNSNLVPWPRNDPTQYWFGTKCIKYFTEIEKLWYYNDDTTNSRIKRLPSNIDKYFTPQCIAYWLMDDGYYDTNKSTIHFCTESFSPSEVNKLIDLFDQKYNIKAVLSRRKNQNNIINYRIRLNRSETNKLINLIKKYIIPSMLYKLGPS